MPATPVAPTATSTTTISLPGPCYKLSLSLLWDQPGLEPDQIVAAAAHIPSSEGCPDEHYIEGEVLFVAVSQTVPGAHPVWGAAPPIPLACTSCEITNFMMPGDDLFLVVLYLELAAEGKEWLGGGW